MDEKSSKRPMLYNTTLDMTSVIPDGRQSISRSTQVNPNASTNTSQTDVASYCITSSENILKKDRLAPTTSISTRSLSFPYTSANRDKRFVSLTSSDYDEMNGCIDFIDKSLIAWYFFQDSDSKVLATAPSRFGRSSILKLLHKFFSIVMETEENEASSDTRWVRRTNVKEEDGTLVEDPDNTSENFKTFKTKKIFKMCHCSTPAVDQECDKCKQWFYEHCGQYPVILVDFASIECRSLATIYKSLNEIIREAYRQHKYLVTKIGEKTVWSNTLEEEMDGHHVSNFLRYCDAIEQGQEDREAYEEGIQSNLDEGLPLLAEYLSLHFKTKASGKGVILLIDKFDAFYCEKQKIGNNVQMFMLGVTRAILKSCPFVKRAFLVACCVLKCILLSLGPNNIQNRHLHSHLYSESFGFTKQEVELLVDVYSRASNTNIPAGEILENIDDLLYTEHRVESANNDIFSPFSVLSYLRSLNRRASLQKEKVGSSQT